VPVTVKGITRAPQLCLLDTGALHNRFAEWVADAAGVDLTTADEEHLAVAGFVTAARRASVQPTLGEVTWEAPEWFCDPWPLAFHLLASPSLREGVRVGRLDRCRHDLSVSGSSERMRIRVELLRGGRHGGDAEPARELVEAPAAEPWLVPAEVDRLEARHEDPSGSEPEWRHVRGREVRVEDVAALGAEVLDDLAQSCAGIRGAGPRPLEGDEWAASQEVERV
jgi:hypothetical protein